MITRWLLALLAMVAFPAPTLAAIAVLNGVVETETLLAAAAQSQTVGYTVTGTGTNRVMVVRIGYQSGNSADMVTSVTWGGVALTRAGQNTSSANTARAVEIWYLVNPTAAADNVVIDLNGTQTFTYCLSAVNTYSGVDDVTPFGVFTESDSEPDTTTVTMNVDSNNLDWCLDVIGTYINATYTIAVSEGADGQSADTIESNNSGFMSVATSRRIASGSTTLMGWTFSTATTGIVFIGAINLRPTGSSTAGTLSTRLLMGCCL